MRRLYLHIGTHKTGTTSIQRFLSENRALLREQGLVYPDNTLGGFKEHYAHHRIAHAMADRPGAGTADDARRFFDALRTHLGEDEVGVISAEALYRHVLPPVGDDAGPVLEAGGGITGDPLTYIRAVRDCIGEFDVTVMVMLRRQDLFIESLYAEQVMSSSYAGGIDEFAEERTWQADYEQRLGMWADVFGEDSLSVRLFEPKTFGVPIEQYFVEWLDGTWDERFVPGELYNVTVPRALVEYKRAINHKQPRGISTTYRRWLEALAAKSPDGALPDLGRYHLTHEARQAYIERFAAGNRRIAERFLGRPDLFVGTPEIPEYPDPPRLSSQHFRRTTRMLLRSIADDRR